MGKALQNRGSTGFRESISEVRWQLHWGYAYLSLWYQPCFPQIKCIKIYDWRNTRPKTAKRTQTGHGKRLQRCETKNNHNLYLLLFHAFLSSALHHWGYTQYNRRSPTIGYLVRKSTIEKGHSSEYCFPLIFNSPERLVKLFTDCLFSVPYYSSKALQRSYSACYKAHDIACVLGWTEGSLKINNPSD